MHKTETGLFSEFTALLPDFQIFQIMTDPYQLWDATIERADSFKLLATRFEKDLKWNKHVEVITSKASKNLYYLSEFTN